MASLGANASMILGVFIFAFLLGANWREISDAAHTKSFPTPQPVPTEHIEEVKTTNQLVEQRQSNPDATGRIQLQEPFVTTKTPTIKTSEVVIDLHKFLGSRAYFQGVSFDVYKCAMPLNRTFKSISPEDFQRVALNFTAQLAESMAQVLGKPHVSTKSSWLDELRQPGQSDAQAMDAVVSDPRTVLWRRHITGIMARFMLEEDLKPFLKCPGMPTKIPLSQLGRDPCPTLQLDDVVRQLGYYALPYIPIKEIAEDALKWGVCLLHPMIEGAFGSWLKEKRMFRADSKTFNVGTLEEDAVVFLFDVLYEKLGVFKNQYWLGTIAMQNPFDMMSISDIIYTVKPDLIIETGTANGGSALLWASMLHLNHIEDGRVLTIDVSPPSWDASQIHWGGVPRSDATKHPLWRKHVTFLFGYSTSARIHALVKEAVLKAKRVLVLLDSHHSDVNVRQETELYCPFVTVQSYCIVQDTKLSRFASEGPLQAAKDYVASHPQDFATDRDRELLFTHHPYGYMKRIAEQDVKPPDLTSGGVWQLT